MLNFVLCDDNSSAIDKLSKMLNTILISHNLKGQLVFTTDNPIALISYVKNNPTHVLLLQFYYYLSEYILLFYHKYQNIILK